MDRKEPRTATSGSAGATLHLAYPLNTKKHVEKLLVDPKSDPKKIDF